MKLACPSSGESLERAAADGAESDDGNPQATEVRDATGV
jgi:hypothetical protein